MFSPFLDLQHRYERPVLLRIPAGIGPKLAPVLTVGRFETDHRIGPFRHGRARHDPYGLTGAHRRVADGAGLQVVYDLQSNRRLLGSGCNVGRAQGVAVER